VVIFLRVGQSKTVFHVLRVLQTREIVIPSDVGNHIEAQEAIGQEHLDLFVERREISLIASDGEVIRTRGQVFSALLGPIESFGGDLVSRERTGARREAAGDDDASLGVPNLVVQDDARVGGDVLG